MYKEASATDLKGLVHREIGEGLTEEELASAVGVSVQTIANILADNLPQDPAIWETFARHFRIHADFLRSGGPPHSDGLFELTESAHHSPIGPLLGNSHRMAGFCGGWTGVRGDDSVRRGSINTPDEIIS